MAVLFILELVHVDSFYKPFLAANYKWLFFFFFFFKFCNSILHLRTFLVLFIYQDLLFRLESNILAERRFLQLWKHFPLGFMETAAVRWGLGYPVKKRSAPAKLSRFAKVTPSQR